MKLLKVLPLIILLLLLPSPVAAEDLSDVVSEVKPAVVVVKGRLALGSGFFISPDGYVLTNEHVVANNGNIFLDTADGRTVRAEVIVTDAAKDLALLKADVTGVSYLKFSKSELREGQEVFTIGAPHGLEFTVTKGIISNPERIVDGNPYIQSDVAVNPGNSGGPLVNISGEVVGIIDWKYEDATGLNFAIPNETTLDFLNTAGITVNFESAPNPPPADANQAISPQTNSEKENPPQTVESEQTTDLTVALIFGLSILLLASLIGIVLLWRQRSKTGVPLTGYSHVPAQGPPLDITLGPVRDCTQVDSIFGAGCGKMQAEITSDTLRDCHNLPTEEEERLDIELK